MKNFSNEPATPGGTLKIQEVVYSRDMSYGKKFEAFDEFKTDWSKIKQILFIDFVYNAWTCLALGFKQKI